MRGLEELHINFYAFPRGSSSEEMLLTPLIKIEGVERVVVGLPLPEIMHPLEELVWPFEVWRSLRRIRENWYGTGRLCPLPIRPDPDHPDEI